MKSGFIFAFSTILIFSFLVLFAIAYSQNVQREETSIFETFEIEKSGFVADDIVNDLNILLGTAVDVNRGPSVTSISFFDLIPPNTDKLQALDFKSFIENQYSLQQNALIDLNVENIVDGKTELFFSNELQYDYSYSANQNSVQFYKKGFDTGVTEYDINVFVGQAEYDSLNSLAWICSSGESVLVRLFFEDSFGNTIFSSCEQNPNILYEYSFAFLTETGNLTISFGDLDQNINAVKVESTLNNPNIKISTFIKAKLSSPGNEISWYYDSDLNYSQTDTNINRKIELGRS